MRRTGIMLCYPFEEKRLTKWAPPWIIQPKLDGDRCRAVFDNHGQLTLFSSEGNQIVSVPHIEDQLLRLGLVNTELDGELYVHGMDHSEIHSRVSRTVELHHDLESVEYHIFDLVSDEPQSIRLFNLLLKLSLTRNNLPNVKAVQPNMVSTLDEIMEFYNRFVSEGYEGFVLRHADAPYVRKRSTYMMKFKPKKEDIYEIVGWKEEHSMDGSPKGRLGALICRAPNEAVFSVGSGLNDHLRTELWHQRQALPGLFVRVGYQHITVSGGVPRFPVLIEVIQPPTQ